MNIEFKNGWPDERKNNPKMKENWLHSDFRVPAYLYVYELYDDICSPDRGGLK